MAMNSLALSTNNLSAQLSAKLDVAGGKVLQVVRATDVTSRVTTSTSYVDVTGMAVTITPQKATSSILIVATAYFQTSSASAAYSTIQITDSSNTAISGSQAVDVGLNSSTANFNQLVLVGWATPGSVASVTYKLRFKTPAGTCTLNNSTQTGQVLAIEVSA